MLQIHGVVHPILALRLLADDQKPYLRLGIIQERNRGSHHPQGIPRFVPIRPYHLTPETLRYTLEHRDQILPAQGSQGLFREGKQGSNSAPSHAPVAAS